MVVRSAKRWFSLALPAIAGAALAACAWDPVSPGERNPPPAPRSDPAEASEREIVAEETGEVVRVRWPRNERFREAHPTVASAQAARFEVQHSTTGAWDGEEVVLTRQMSQRPAQSMWRYYSEGTETSTPPLERQEQYGMEEFIHHAPARGSNFYRCRELIWDSGRIVSTGPWSATARVEYTGREVPRLPASLPAYDPGGLPSLIITQLVANTAPEEASVPYAAVGARQRAGPGAWRSDFATLQNTTGLLSRSGAIGWCVKDLGVRKLYLDDGRSPGTSGRARITSLPRPTGAFPSRDPVNYATHGAFADDATMSLPELWWRGLQHERRDPTVGGANAREGARLRAFVERYGDWDNGLVGPKFVYLGCPFTENGSFETEALLAKSHMRPIAAESHYVIMGTTATAQITDEATGDLTAVGRFVKWWHETYPGHWIFVEPGLRRQRTRHWMDSNDFPRVGSWQTIDVLFNQPLLSRERRLELRTGGRGVDDDALDPRAYPERRHIVYVGPNVCPYVAEARSNQEMVARLIEVCEMLYAFDKRLIVQIGPLGPLGEMRADQAAALVRLAESNAAPRRDASGEARRDAQ